MKATSNFFKHLISGVENKVNSATFFFLISFGATIYLSLIKGDFPINLLYLDIALLFVSLSNSSVSALCTNKNIDVVSTMIKSVGTGGSVNDIIGNFATSLKDNTSQESSNTATENATTDNTAQG